MGSEPLTLYYRHGCSLCDEMLQGVRTLQQELGFSFHIMDVDADPALEGRYGEWVPVLCAGEQELCHYFLDQAAVRRYFAAP